MPGEKRRLYWGLRTFCLVTGGSRGIGPEIAYQFSKMFKSGSLVVIVARSVRGLEATKARIEANCPGVKVKVTRSDLYQPNNKEYHDIITDALREFNYTARSFEHAIIVHNAAVLMPAIPIPLTDDLNMLYDDINVNLYSPISLNVQFLKVFPKGKVAKRSVIQISSVGSLMAVPLGGFYCMAKAARNMYFKALALEDPTLDVLNYSPGTVDTDMSRAAFSLVDSKILDGLRKTGDYLSPETTAKYLVKLLAEGDYQSGDYKDIWTMEENLAFMQKLGPKPPDATSTNS